MPRLLSVIQDPESRTVENLPATENAISAVTKICKYHSELVNVNEILPHWLSWLPVWEDEDEAVHIYNYLCDLLEVNHPLILGENNCNIPLIVKIIAEAFHRDAVDKEKEVEVLNRMLNVVRHIMASPEMMTACMAVLTEEQKTALNERLTVPS